MTLEQRNVWRKFLLEDGASGMATIEVLLIIAVLIALVILFKDTILGFVTEILGNISTQGTSFDPASMVP
ncbi:MAG: hypothetical protein IJM83_03705 [Firmicutes bacterium]|nr:hypothetical protein [Bacillota bacterium]MBQ7058393.1 hypothetical protein [Bacillota bacterium]